MPPKGEPEYAGAAALEGAIAAALDPRLSDLADEWYHTYSSRRSRDGYPDYTIVLGPWLIFAELKRSGGSPTAAQARWLRALRGPWRLCLLVGGQAGADQLVRLLERIRSGAVAPWDLDAAKVAVQVLGEISPRGRLAVVDSVGGDDQPAAAVVAPTTPRRHRPGTRSRPRGS